MSILNIAYCKHLTLPLIFHNIKDVPPHFMCCIKLSEAIHAQEQLTGLSETSYLIESHVSRFNCIRNILHQHPEDIWHEVSHECTFFNRPLSLTPPLLLFYFLKSQPLKLTHTSPWTSWLWGGGLPTSPCPAGKKEPWLPVYGSRLLC